MPRIGPVDGVQVGLRRLPSHAAVLVRAMAARILLNVQRVRLRHGRKAMTPWRVLAIVSITVLAVLAIELGLFYLWGVWAARDFNP